jgi:hypothetical protein
MKLFWIGVLLAMNIPGAERVERPSTPARVWVRRITLGAACAASLVFDPITTNRAVSAGAVEGNGLLANSQGRPRWGLMFGIKTATCVASGFLQERYAFRDASRNDWTFTGINVGLAAAYTGVGLHNLRLADDLAKR